jgi:hypothetical protein
MSAFGRTCPSSTFEVRIWFLSRRPLLDDGSAIHEARSTVHEHGNAIHKCERL